MKQWAKTWSGFTIVELLIVIVVIGILATLAVVGYNGVRGDADQNVTFSEANKVSAIIASYSTRNEGSVPPDLGSAGVSETDSVTYQYTPNTTVTPQVYCLTVQKASAVSHIATGGRPTPGPCNGHSGGAPTTTDAKEPCPTGFIVVPGSSLYGTRAFCVMKFEAKNVGGLAVSQADLLPWASISQINAKIAAENACVGCRLMTYSEWMTIAHNVLNVDENWSGGTVGSGFIYSGHNDGAPAANIAGSVDDTQGYINTGQAAGSNQKRTLRLNNGEIIWDLSGNVWEWTATISPSGAGIKPGGYDFDYREWNSPQVFNTGRFEPNIFPQYGTAAAANWDANQGLGRIYSSNSDPAARVLTPGGQRFSGTDAGIFSLDIDFGPTSTGTAIGFRVVR